MRSKGSAQELENRRRLAVQRVHDGYSSTAVARFLGVQPRSVQRWLAAARAQGPQGLTAKPHPGRTPKLTFDQEVAVVSWLEAPATAFGFANDLWTAPRVAHLIRQRFGVAFHPRYVNAWLTDRGVTPQKPQRVPRERDQQAIDRWLDEDWPRLKKKRPSARPISS
jgi:transposase